MAVDTVVLSYHDSLLRQSDLLILDGSTWLNDNLITFFFEYLDKNVCKDRQDIAFVGPGITQFLKIGGSEEIQLFVASLDLQEKNYIFLPVNDSVAQESPGGSHWSLLLYSRVANMFYHFDSMRDTNAIHARQLMNNLTPALPHAQGGVYSEKDCCQQENSFDCGLHVIYNAEALANYYVHNEPAILYQKLHSTEMRSKLKTLILSLTK